MCAFTGTSMHALGTVYSNMSTWADVVRACHRDGQWWGQAADFRGPGRVLSFLVVLSTAATCECMLSQAP